MTLEDFEASIEAASPSAELSAALRALWWDARGDWNKAHEAAQSADDAASAWVHAYLHRKEGDLSNAAYWYRRAGREMSRGTLVEEWRMIVRALLSAPIEG
jgi:hypothetical protein